MLAIVIPYFKLTFFEATLQSLANQTDKRFKVYIGDDASPEDCTSLVKQYEGSFDFTYHRFETNIGGTSLTQQWERCIALSNKEEWIMILGDEDVLEENVVEEFYKKYLEFSENYKVIRYGVIKINEEGSTTSSLISNSILEDSKELLFKNKRSSLSEYIFSKSTVKEIGFKDFPLAWWSDVLAVLEFSNFGMLFSINDSYVKVRLSQISISGSSYFGMQKQRASYMFYNYLLTNRIKHFDDKEIEFLLDRFSKLYINNKKNIKLFYKISITFFKIGKFKMYLEFLNRIINSISK